jgi:hypothetical protein
MVLSTVAPCTTTVKSIPSSRSALSNTLPISRCPLLLTGRNSVNPWTIPRITASMVLIKPYLAEDERGFFIMAQISKANPKSTTMGANVVRRKLKSSFSLNWFGSSEPPPIINKNPTTIIAKPMLRRI